MKRSPLSILLFLLVIVVGGYAAYRYMVKPWLEKRALEKAIEKGCEDVLHKFDEQKEEIVDDLAKLIEKIEIDMQPQEAQQENEEIGHK